MEKVEGHVYVIRHSSFTYQYHVESLRTWNLEKTLKNNKQHCQHSIHNYVMIIKSVESTKCVCIGINNNNESLHRSLTKVLMNNYMLVLLTNSEHQWDASIWNMIISIVFLLFIDDKIQYPNGVNLFHRFWLKCNAVLRHTMATHAVPIIPHYSRFWGRLANPIGSISNRVNAMAMWCQPSAVFVSGNRAEHAHYSVCIV